MTGSVNKASEASATSPLVEPTPRDGASLVFVWPYVESGGVQRYFLAIAKHVPAHVRCVAILSAATNPGVLGELRALGITCVLIDGSVSMTAARSWRERVRSRWRLWHVQWHLWRAIRPIREGAAFHCDLSPVLFTWLLWWLARSADVVVTIHTAFPRVSQPRALTWRWRLTALVRLRRFRLTTSTADARSSLRPYLPAADVASIPVVPGAVDLAELRDAAVTPAARDRVRGALGVAPGRFLVCAGGQFVDRKGCWVLVEAARELQADIEVVWIGQFALAPDVAARLSAMHSPLRYVSRYDSGLSRHDYLQMIASADVFVLPSFVEGLPLALLEALGLGLPVVTTPINGIPEAITHETEGLLVTPGDPQALAAAIARLRTDAPLRQRLGEAGKHRAVHFSSTETARLMFDIYRGAPSTAAASLQAW